MRTTTTIDAYTRDVAEHVARQLPPVALALALAAPTRGERARWLADASLGEPLLAEKLREAHAALEEPEIARDAEAFVEALWPSPRPPVPCALCERNGLERTHGLAMCPILAHAVHVTEPSEKARLRDDARIVVAAVASEETALLEIIDEGETWLYGAEDWRDDAAPSFGWEFEIWHRTTAGNAQTEGLVERAASIEAAEARIEELKDEDAGREEGAPIVSYEIRRDLRQHDGQRFYGRPIPVVARTEAEAEALLRRTWPDQAGVFV